MAYYVKTLIFFIVIINLEGIKASLIIEEEPDFKKNIEKEAPSPESGNAHSFTSVEQETLLRILGQRYKERGPEDFDKFVDSLSQYLDSPPAEKPFSAESLPPKTSGGWVSNQGRCRIVGYSCSSGGGWSSNNGGWRSDEKEEQSSPEKAGWGSGWGENNGKCCNNDYCVNGKCCIPTPSRGGNSRCKKDSDCCSSGACVEGQCCVKGCTNDTCTKQSDCCPVSGTTASCEMSTNKCVVGFGGSCSCDSQCAGAFLCSSSSGKCCVNDGGGPCTADTDCCNKSTGSYCGTNKSNRHKCVSGGRKKSGDREFIYDGTDF